MDEMWQDRMPPQDIQAEQAVLGSVFLDPEEINNAMEVLEAKDFYQRRHQLIFSAMVALFDRGEAIDVVTLKAELERNNALENVGGIGYLVELSQATPYAGSLSFYAKIVNDKSVLRSLIQAANQIAPVASNRMKTWPISWKTLNARFWKWRKTATAVAF